MDYDRSVAQGLTVCGDVGEVSPDRAGPFRETVGQFDRPAGQNADPAPLVRLDVLQDAAADETGWAGDEEVEVQGAVFRSSSGRAASAAVAA